MAGIQIRRDDGIYRATVSKVEEGVFLNLAFNSTLFQRSLGVVMSSESAHKLADIMLKALVSLKLGDDELDVVITEPQSNFLVESIQISIYRAKSYWVVALYQYEYDVSGLDRATDEFLYDYTPIETINTLLPDKKMFLVSQAIHNTAVSGE